MIIRFVITAFVLITLLTGWTSTAANAQTENYTYLIYIKGLSMSDIEGKDLPNLKSIAETSISYTNVAKPQKFPDSIYTLFGDNDKEYSLPELLTKNGINSMLIDGSGKIPKKYCDNNHLDLISGTDDKEVLNRYFALSAKKEYSFVTIYLDDLNTSETTEFRRWSLVDNQIGLLLNHLIKSKKIDHSSIFVTGDSVNPPLLMFRYNPGLKANYYYCNLLDLGPTICELYGINQPAEMPGSILYEFLTGPGDPMSAKRIADLQKQCLLAEEKINLLQKDNDLIHEDKIKILEEKLSFDQRILEKEKEITVLKTKLKLFKLAGFVLFIILMAGYIIEYRILRKKYLIFP